MMNIRLVTIYITFILSFCSGIATYAAEKQAKPSPQKGPLTKVSWNFVYNNFPLKIKVYKVPTDAAFDVGDTKDVSIGSPLPFSEEVVGPATISLKKISNFALAIENRDRTKPLYFFANFHSIKPGENSIGMKVSCLCNNHVFKVKPNSVWYRIVQLYANPFYTGNMVELKHEIFGLSEEDIRVRNLQREIDAPG